MNVLVIGSGGREHALVWKLAQSARVKKLYCAPGNPGIGSLAELVPLKATDTAGLLEWARQNAIALTVVGPEQPLAEGIVDAFRREGLVIFGPTRSAAELEWSKSFAKDFMMRHNIPTAAYRKFASTERKVAEDYLAHCSLPVVLKADGLAAGKGVIICQSKEEAQRAFAALTQEGTFGSAGSRILVEEFLQGEEASVFAVTDGTHSVVLAPAQDHKRVFDDDRGKNTGGMGAYAPAPCVTSEVLELVVRKIITPTLKGMVSEGRTYTGCLYVGLMLTKKGPMVVEYNCRFGDPETQAVLPLYQGDLAELLYAASSGAVKGDGEPSPAGGSAVCVVIASGGYPDAFASGKKISGLHQAESREGIVVFHAGTRQGPDGSVVTSGGRVLGVTDVGRSKSLAETIAAAYNAVSDISFEGMHYRKDIGRKALR
ncbi:MAG TPA: phosphoribosylamine--glycine ligase [Bacteroidota bacterium]|nr:phosphoribosylamine--glycine ligase [Bacteroidota bacterium]